jgi:hypothetical protein
MAIELSYLAVAFVPAILIFRIVHRATRYRIPWVTSCSRCRSQRMAS